MEGDIKKDNFQNELHSASSTLKRLNLILDAISHIHLNFGLRMEEKQTIKIELIRQFFINSVPLLEETEIKEIQDEILNLKPISKTGIKSGAHTTRQIYDPKLALELDKILIKLQTLTKKYFMPSGSQELKNKKSY
jgi:hypothetical protein